MGGLYRRPPARPPRPAPSRQAAPRAQSQPTAQRMPMHDISQVPVAGVAQRRSTLPDGLKSGIEQLSGMAMDGVKVHYGSPEPAQLNAHAFTRGNDIHLAPGQESNLPHEAWHVVQQAQGRVRPTIDVGGSAVNDDPGLEREADSMGAKASSLATPVQRKIKDHGGAWPAYANHARAGRR